MSVWFCPWAQRVGPITLQRDHSCDSLPDVFAALGAAADQVIEAGRNTFTEAGDPECRKDPGKNVHGVMRTQDENGCDFENNDQESGNGEPSPAQPGKLHRAEDRDRKSVV